MRGDLPAAALRLCAALPVRTVEHKPRVPLSRQLAHYYAKKERRPRVVTGRGRGGLNNKPFVCEGRRFNGIKDAAEKLHRSPHTIRAWLDSGKARYI